MFHPMTDPATDLVFFQWQLKTIIWTLEQKKNTQDSSQIDKYIQVTIMRERGKTISQKTGILIGLTLTINCLLVKYINK